MPVPEAFSESLCEPGRPRGHGDSSILKIYQVTWFQLFRVVPRIRWLNELSPTKFERHLVVFLTAARDIWIVPANNSSEIAMPEGDGSSAWDFLTIVTSWSLYGLPVLLLAIATFVLVKKRRLDRSNLADISLDGRRVVGIVALIHVVLGLHGAVLLVQELLTFRVMGVSESFVNLITETLAVIVNPLLAMGLWRAKPAARWAAIAWYAFLAALGAMVAHWLWRFHVPIEPRQWPDQLAGKVMPFVLSSSCSCLV